MTQTKERPTPTSEAKTSGPLIAHWEDLLNSEPNVGLCGKKLLGITATPDAQKCVVCLDLYPAYRARLLPWLPE